MIPFPESERKPVLVAVGGGKGGVGKSVLSVLLGNWLALLDKRTVVADLDLSGANLHTLLGIRNVPCTLGDLLNRRVNSLHEILLRTTVPNLRVVCGADDDLTLANIRFAQKIKLMKKLMELDADYVVLDLGAGTSFNVLDFFLLADVQIVVTTAEPIALYNAYGFLRNAVFRRLSQLTRRVDALREVVQQGIDPRNQHNLHTVRDVMEALAALAGDSVLPQVGRELSRIRPGVVVNRVRDERDRNASSVIRQVARKYLLMQVEELGGVLYDRKVERMVASMQPLTKLHDGSAFEGSYDLAAALVNRGSAGWGASDAAATGSMPVSAAR